ncbi:MAG: SDR family NAD(P)-dependent oxidoreductase [Oscillochloris sp.]|nr:SDR family NAD(P)-dependent oxidoreductase [Oscillochloris sp.]
MAKHILISGASRGIGRATALALAAPDVALTLAARSVEALEEIAAEVRMRGAEAQVVPCDLTAEPHVHRLVEVAAGAEGRIDVAIHSVGGALVAPLHEIRTADWEASMRQQLTSLFLLTRYATARMQAGGLLINIASVAARQVFPGWAVYAAAKHGALGFLGAVREELRSEGVRVCSILPAAVDTALWDAVPGEWNRANMLQPDDVAAAVQSIVALPDYVTVEDLTIGHVAGRL